MGLTSLEPVAKCNVNFDDLPVLDVSSSSQSADFSRRDLKGSEWLLQRSKPPDDWVIWKRPKVWLKDTPKPFHLQMPSDHGRIPPASMDYNVFSARVNQLKADGVLGKK